LLISVKDEYSRGLYAPLKDIFEFEMVGVPLLAMLIHIILFFIILMIVEYKPEISGLFLRCSRGTFFKKHVIISIATRSLELNDFTLDEDVLKEKKIVATQKPQDSMIQTSQLTKVWDNKKVAVDSLSLSIPRHECFGLLGENGAGKTTTISMLCGYTLPSSGSAYLNSYNIVTQTR
jgi:ATP-binding cassette subfamily A (ABC1) protein 3